MIRAKLPWLLALLLLGGMALACRNRAQKSPLVEKVEATLGRNLLLELKHIQVKVVGEAEGVVTLDVRTGDRQFREKVRAGADLRSTADFPTKIAQGDANSLQMSVDVLKKIPGVRSVKLLSTPNPELDARPRALAGLWHVLNQDEERAKAGTGLYWRFFPDGRMEIAGLVGRAGTWSVLDLGAVEVEDEFNSLDWKVDLSGDDRGSTQQSFHPFDVNVYSLTRIDRDPAKQVPVFAACEGGRAQLKCVEVSREPCEPILRSFFATAEDCLADCRQMTAHSNETCGL